MSDQPAWANEPDYNNDPKYNNDDWQKDDAPTNIKVDAPKKAEPKKRKNRFARGKGHIDGDDEEPKKECCTSRLKRYLGIWLFFVVCIVIGIVIMSYADKWQNGLYVFLIGFLGLLCSSFCFRKCDYC